MKNTNTVSLLDIVNEAERFSPKANMLSAFRLLEMGNYLDLKKGQNIIDCGCGNGEALCLWSKYFETRGLGVDSHEPSIAGAKALAGEAGVGDRTEFVHADVQEFDFSAIQSDVVACLGATFCFGGFEKALHAMKNMITPGGQIVIGEAFFTTHDVPDELKEYEGDEPTETELFDIVRAAGCEVGYYSRASRGEWERYIFNSNSCVKDYLSGGESKSPRRWQDMYINYRQKWQEMAFMTVHTA